MENFAGKNGYVWWTGVVEKNDDPLKAGRCRVRIFGWHTDDLNVIPTEDLPWAMVQVPAASAQSFTTFREGDYVCGFFLDGISGQAPVITGSFISIPAAEPNINKGFSPQVSQENIPKMPVGQIDRKIGNPTTAPLSRGVVANTSIAMTNADLAHVCGFKLNFNLNVDLGLGELTAAKQLATAFQDGVKAGKKGVADVVRKQMMEAISALRKVINTIIKTIGAADVTGTYSYTFSQLKSLTRQVNSYISQAADALYYAGAAVGVIQAIQELVKWVSALPEKMKQMIQGCLNNFVKSTKSVINNINALPSQVESSVKIQLSSFTNGLTQSINTIQSQIKTDSQNQNTTLTEVLNGNGSSTVMEALTKLLEPPSKAELLKNATKTSIQRP